MDRRRYEMVALAVVLAAVALVSLLRYQRSRPRWHHVLTLPLTGVVHTAALRTAPETRLNLNTASRAELDALPGITPATAQAICAARQRAPLADLVELLQYEGIGEQRLAQIAELAYCGPVTNASPGTDHD
jgi:DNA uptake protein ComE-like DNA-binding protein